MSRGIRFSVDTERTLEHLEEDLFASSRRRALPREEGKLAERRNAVACRSSTTKRFLLLAAVTFLRLAVLFLDYRIVGRVGFARRYRCAIMPFAPYRVTTAGHR